MKIKKILKPMSSLKNISIIKNTKNAIQFQKQMYANMDKIKDFILKSNLLTNDLKNYMEKHKQTENEELLKILNQLIVIQELFMIKTQEKVIGD